MTKKEKRAAYMKEYYKANKEELKAQSKAYYKTNKESRKEECYSVYYLPEEHYVGMTGGIKNRMRRHKFDGMITDGYEIVFTSTNKKEALAFEGKLHSLGYNGSVKDGYLAARQELTKSLKEASKEAA